MILIWAAGFFGSLDWEVSVVPSIMKWGRKVSTLMERPALGMATSEPIATVYTVSLLVSLLVTAIFTAFHLPLTVSGTTTTASFLAIWPDTGASSPAFFSSFLPQPASTTASSKNGIRSNFTTLTFSPQVTIDRQALRRC